MSERGYFVYTGENPNLPHVQISDDGFRVIDSKGEIVTICQDLKTALAWTRLMPVLRRVWIDGLPWCAECHRAVDRGWSHDPGCPLNA